MSSLRVIDGNTHRDIAANEMRNVFGEAADDVLNETGRVSGFVIVAFDDQGNPTWRVEFGEMFPIPSPLVPDIVKQCVSSTIYGGE